MSLTAVRLGILLSTISCLAVNPSASATTRTWPKPWRLLVFDAAFIGVVECERGGLLMVDYRVVESWKGAVAGTLIRVEHQPMLYEPVAPGSEAGQRYLLLANRSTGTSQRPLPWRLDGRETVWWRDTGCSLSVDWGDRRPEDLIWTDWQPPFLGILAPDAVACRESVAVFLSLPRAAQEALVLREGYPSLLKGLWTAGAPADSQNLPTDASTLLGAVVDSVIRSATPPRDGWRDPSGRWLGSYGGDRTLALLRHPRGLVAYGVDSTSPTHPIHMIKVRRGLVDGGRTDYFDLPEQPGDSLRQRYIETLARGLPVSPAAGDQMAKFSEAVRVLTTYEPTIVEDFLASIRRDDVDGTNEGFVHAAASYFAWKCPSNRAQRLSRLLVSPHPVVRVAAAVYLALTDSTQALGVLRAETNDPGLGGQWAAVVLASRGEKVFVDRALPLFRDAPFTINGSRRNLQARLAVLLSNSAVASRVEPPPGWQKWNFRNHQGIKDGAAWQEYIEWWSRVSTRIETYDPWLPRWIAQGVD